ncbi:hypothetical protein D3C87_1125740 [compost metagenome]
MAIQYIGGGLVQIPLVPELVVAVHRFTGTVEKQTTLGDVGDPRRLEQTGGEQHHGIDRAVGHTVGFDIGSRLECRLVVSIQVTGVFHHRMQRHRGQSFTSRFEAGDQSIDGDGIQHRRWGQYISFTETFVPVSQGFNRRSQRTTQHGLRFSPALALQHLVDFHAHHLTYTQHEPFVVGAGLRTQVEGGPRRQNCLTDQLVRLWVVLAEHL